MSRSSKNVSVPASIAIVAVGVIALISSGALRPAPVTGGTPSRPPVADPSVPANPDPATPAPATPVPATPAPTKEPVDDFSDDEKLVKLDIATQHRVFVGVKDFTDKLVDATSGRAGDGMSVRWHELKVENVDDDTLRLTWVGLPNDDPVKVIVTDLQGTPTIVLFQMMPPPNSDALGFDRVLDLHFEAPVAADYYDVYVQDGMDTDD